MGGSLDALWAARMFFHEASIRSIPSLLWNIAPPLGGLSKSLQPVLQFRNGTPASFVFLALTRAQPVRPLGPRINRQKDELNFNFCVRASVWPRETDDLEFGR